MSKKPQPQKRFSKEKRKLLAKRYNESEEKVEQFATVFKEMDKEEKGIIDKGAFLKAVMKLGFAFAPKQAEKLVKVYKGGKGAGIDMDGFLVAMLHKMKWGKEETVNDAKKMFKDFDKNGDHFLSPEELRAGMEKIGDPMTDEEADELLKMADKNGDGRISYDEFLELWKQIYG